MGCTPSIHVSQTGVVYCKGSEESNSPHPSSLGANPAQGLSPGTGGTSATSEGHSTSSQNSSRRTGKQKNTRTPKRRGRNITEAETQTAPPTMKGINPDVHLGPMRIKQHAMSVLLVFGKEDAQSDGFWWAAERGGYKCTLARNAESALEVSLEKHPDVVIVDARHTKYFDAEAFCRSIRADKAREHMVLIAVSKRYSGDKEEPSIMNLLNAGFNRRFIENSDVSACLNELLSLEYGEVRAQIKLRAAQALLLAVENCNDGIEITSEDRELQYMNPACERLCGYTCEELIGKDLQELPRSDRNKPDLHESINTQLNKGKTWEGMTHTKRKTGESTPLNCKIIPVLGHSGKFRHFVSVKRPVLDLTNSQTMERYNNDFTQISNGGVHGFQPKRKESLSRIHSMTIEAPITKVINIINAAQEDSPLTVVQALDKVLEILRSSELYSPYFGQHVKEDQMTNDLVEGLMTTQGLKRRMSSNDMTITRQCHHIASSPTSSLTLTHVPQEIQAILDKEANWDFDIIELERVTNKRPLVYLGLKIFQRFGVLEFLRVSETVMYNWLQMIEANYHASNPYHNSTHAADVLQGTAYFLSTQTIKSLFDGMDEVAALISAVIHDLDHPGRTNSFLINAGSELAVLYNDLAVLESHHVSLAYLMTRRDDRVNIFKNMDHEDFMTMRQQIIDMVLATEMTKHFEHLSKFLSAINNPLKDDESNAEGSTCDSPVQSSVARYSSSENRTLIKRMLIKCADVSNPTRPLDLCMEWAKRIASEYSDQTDEERARGLTLVMPIFDRRICNVPKSQTSFIDFFIKNMFHEWDAFCDVPELISHLTANYAYWKDHEEEAAIQIVEKQKAEALENTNQDGQKESS